MCGRMTQRTDPAVVAELFGAELRGEGVEELRPRYNIAPTDPLLVVLRREEARVATRVRWGLIPPWAKTAAEGARMFNARAETVATSPAFRSAFAKRRCLVPTEGFYEWDKVSGSRQPYLIAPGAGGLLALAGIWSAWKDPETGLWVPCASVITTAADATVGAIHDRMPVPLPEASWERWLDPALPDPGEALGILGAAAPALVLVPVSRAVNSVRNDGPELIAPVDPATAAAEPPPASRARARRTPPAPDAGSPTLFGED